MPPTRGRVLSLEQSGILESGIDHLRALLIRLCCVPSCRKRKGQVPNYHHLCSWRLTLTREYETVANISATYAHSHSLRGDSSLHSNSEAKCPIQTYHYYYPMLDDASVPGVVQTLLEQRTRLLLFLDVSVRAQLR